MRARETIRFTKTIATLAQRAGLTAALVMLGLSAGFLEAQQGLIFSDSFRYCPGFYPPPHQQQMQSLLKSGGARELPGGQLALSGGVELWTFLKTGETNMIARTPECTYDRTRNAVGSTGQLKVETTGGKFSIEGVGFLWRQTNSSLMISNHVHTIVQPDMFASSATNRTAEGRTATAPERLEIFSKTFSYGADSGLGAYAGGVRVAGTNLAIHSEALDVEVPYKEGQVHRITARQDVTIDYGAIRGAGEVHATGQKADYLTDTGLIELTGNPTWRAGQREGRGDTLTIDQTNKVFRSEGHAWLRMPGQSARESGFFGHIQPQGETAATGANEFIEVTSDGYEVRTNSAVFHGNVQVGHIIAGKLEGKMSCALLELTFFGTNQLQTLTAQNHVVVEQFDPSSEKRFTGSKLDFDAPSGLLTLSDHPAWQVGQRQGRGDILEANVRQDKMVMRGHAWMKLPAGELRASAGGALARPAPAGEEPSTNQFAEIFCDEYRLSKTTALFNGNVRIDHPQMTWLCDRITVDFPPEGGRANRMLAEPQVEFFILNTKGQTVHGTGQKALYTYSVSPGSTNELMELRGNLALLCVTNTGATFRGPIVMWDLASNKMFGSPGYTINVPHVETGTNNLLFGK